MKLPDELTIGGTPVTGLVPVGAIGVRELPIEGPIVVGPTVSELVPVDADGTYVYGVGPEGVP